MASLVVLALAADLAAPAELKARGHGEDLTNWNNLKQLPAGQDVQVVLNDSKSYRGKFQSASDDALVLRLAAGDQTFPAASVVRVSFKAVSHRLRNLALGAAIRLGGGAGIGAAAGNPNAIGGRGITAGVAAVIGLAAGVGVGAALPTGGWHEVYGAR